MAMKTFVDNVCRQVVERHITRSLPSIFSAEKVAALSDDDLVRTGETPERVAKRKQTQELREKLESRLEDLRRNPVVSKDQSG
jgi:hypothetical protein